MNTETSILLPGAAVDLFLKDRATIEAARALADDWRFARVKITVHEGEVETAIRAYAQSSSPDIIMVETDTTDGSFIGRLGELSGSCNSGTSAIVIGPVNDVNLYRSLTAMGVSDYLVFPVPQDTLGEVIAQTLIEKLGASGSRLIAVVGAKGGVGASAIAQAIGWTSAEMLEQKTILLDGAGAWSALGVGLGFEPVASTAEVVKAAAAKDSDSLRRMINQVSERFFALATGTEPMLDMPAQIAQFEEVINMAVGSYPVVIVDLSAAVPSLKKMVLTRAHETIVVSTPTLSSLRLARSLMQEIKKLHGGQGQNIDLVINMQGLAPGKEVAKGDMKAALEVEPAASLPFDPKLFVGAENEGRKISSDKTGQEILQKLLPLIQKIVNKSGAVSTAAAKDDGLLGGLLGKLKAGK